MTTTSPRPTMRTAPAAFADNGSVNDRTHWEHIRILARRTDSKEPGGPPWAWPNLNPQERGWLNDALDEFVDSYTVSTSRSSRKSSRVAGASIPRWRRNCRCSSGPGAAPTSIRKPAWPWPSTTTPEPCPRSKFGSRLLGKGAVNCRKGNHTRTVEPAIVDAHHLRHRRSGARNRPRRIHSPRPPKPELRPRRTPGTDSPAQVPEPIRGQDQRAIP